MKRRTVVATTAAASLCWAAGCVPSQPNELDKLGTVDVQIKGQNFRLWIADENDERLAGLMFVTAEQMADLPDGTKRGMIFVFSFEQFMSFWMRNTIIPLDIAYLDSTGAVLNTHTMMPLDDRPNQYPSDGRALMAIEVNEGVFGELGLTKGDLIALSAELRNSGR
jgi:uncharacterized membrane protein (UPF0127 family)